MPRDLSMKDALFSRPGAVALGCMDTRSGLVLDLQVRGEVTRDEIEAAAVSAVQLCSAPCTEAGTDQAAPTDCDEAFVVSSRWVHVYARVPSDRDLVVVGLAPGDANVALLRSWIRDVAGRVGHHA